MSELTVEETNLICIYNTGSREGLLAELSEMQSYLQKDERELLELTHSVINKINNMSDERFNRIISSIVANFE